MDSAELLVLLEELPETSKFKEASERTFWLAEYTGDDEELKGKLLKILARGKPPTDVKVISTFIDWTFDRKLLARNTRELASMRADNGVALDLTGLIEPTTEAQQAYEAEQDARMRNRMASFINTGLYGNVQ